MPSLFFMNHICGSMSDALHANDFTQHLEDDRATDSAAHLIQEMG